MTSETWLSFGLDPRNFGTKAMTGAGKGSHALPLVLVGLDLDFTERGVRIIDKRVNDLGIDRLASEVVVIETQSPRRSSIELRERPRMANGARSIRMSRTLPLTSWPMGLLYEISSPTVSASAQATNAARLGASPDVWRLIRIEPLSTRSRAAVAKRER